MPEATYTNLVLRMSVAGIKRVEIHGGTNDQFVKLEITQKDQNGDGLPDVIVRTMTPAAFFTALQAASGNFTNRLFQIALAELGIAGTVA